MDEIKTLEGQEAITKKSPLHKFADWLDGWHVTRIFQAFGSFLLVLTLIGFYFDYLARQMDRELAQEERDARLVDRRVSAWQLLTTKASGNSGKIDALEYLNSIGEPLAGIDLSVEQGQVGTYLSRANLEGAHLSRANLEGANLSVANLEGAMLYGANLIEADLTLTNLSGANLSGAYLIEANLSGAYLYEANLSGANLSEAFLFKANLDGAKLRKANLEGAKNLTCIQLTQAKNWEDSYRDEQLACGASIPE